MQVDGVLASGKFAAGGRAGRRGARGARREAGGVGGRQLSGRLAARLSGHSVDIDGIAAKLAIEGGYRIKNPFLHNLLGWVHATGGI